MKKFVSTVPIMMLVIVAIACNRGGTKQNRVFGGVPSPLMQCQYYNPEDLIVVVQLKLLKPEMIM